MDCIDVCYKTVGSHPIYLNVYPPKDLIPGQRLPALIYFHGGGLTVGTRTSWFPTWLTTRLAASGIVFISAAYRLFPQATLHDIGDDVKDIFTFLSKKDLSFRAESGQLFGVDAERIGVAGTSAGGTCAYLAAIHAVPRPKAVLGIYAMLGNAFSAHVLTPKTAIFSRGRELLDPAKFAHLLYPGYLSDTTITTESELAYLPADSPTPGWPANPRMPLSRLYQQLGTMLDYCTGLHSPSLSASLRPLLAEYPAESDALALHDAVLASGLVPGDQHVIIPQFNISRDFPPTYLWHGALDTAVPCAESRVMGALLERAGVPVTLRVVEGVDHSFDYVPDAEERYGHYFDEMVQFLKTNLG
ncbi:MYND finger domain-like protein [Mycena indigotica]|uniref:MYND finger domain-like protein n=1 Tax=Mycena indigotica TaxID=2126181 RepID=A0A8H6VYG1_9AGAR|nr:MYND finger domain-like protein [Mycena indigotica]KAF7298784.1 MYND finger domain-like protein [Mycena indigotica]